MHPPAVFSLLIMLFNWIYLYAQQSVTSYIAPVPKEKAAIWSD